MKVTQLLVLLAATSCFLSTVSASHKTLSWTYLRKLRDAGCNKDYLKIISVTPLKELENKECYITTKLKVFVSQKFVTKIGNATVTITTFVQKPIYRLNCVSIKPVHNPKPVKHQPRCTVKAAPVVPWWTKFIKKTKTTKKVTTFKLSKEVSWYDFHAKKVRTTVVRQTVTIKNTVTFILKKKVGRKTVHSSIKFHICK